MTSLLIEVGNTALKAAWSEETTLGKIFRYQGEKKIEYILSLTERQKPEVLAVASCYPLSEEELIILGGECSKLIVMDERHTGIAGRYLFPAYLSPDRIASLIALRYLFSGRGCTLFDFGTSLKVDFLSSDGSYSGGNISLGCRTRFKALERYTHSLPLLDTPDEISDTGYSLESSIESGVISGIMFEIEGYLDKKKENNIVFTGGDAIYFAKKLKSSIFVVSNLSLMGLAIVTDDYVRTIIQ